MNASLRRLSLLLALAFSLFGAPLARSAAIDLITPGDEFGGNWTLGFAFTVSQDILVNSLGVYDSGKNGLASAASVGLWDIDHNLQLATVGIAAGTVAELDGYFRYSAVTPVLLLKDVRYVVGSFVADIGSSVGITGRGGEGSFDPVIQVLSNRYVASSSLSLPVHSVAPIGEGAFLGGNFRFSLATVPEPTTLLLLSGGLVALRRRRPQRG